MIKKIDDIEENKKEYGEEIETEDLYKIYKQEFREYVVPIQKRKEKKKEKVNPDDYLFDDDEVTTIEEYIKMTEKEDNTEKCKTMYELQTDIYKLLNEINSSLKTIEEVLTNGGE